MLKKISYILSYIISGIYTILSLFIIVISIVGATQAGNSSDVDLKTEIYLLILYALLVAALAVYAFYFGNKVRKAYTKSETTVVAIISLFLLGILPGLLCLLSDETDYIGYCKAKIKQKENKQNEINEEVKKAIKKQEEEEESPSNKLMKLNDLLDKKLITQEEYDKARQKIIDEI